MFSGGTPRVDPSHQFAVFPEKALSDVERRGDFSKRVPRSPAFDRHAAEGGGILRVE